MAEPNTYPDAFPSGRTPRVIGHPEATGLVDAGGRAWQPTRKQVAYLECWLDPSKPKSISAICREVGISRSNLRQWRKGGAFEEWFNKQCEQETNHLWQPLLARLAQLAMQGSVEHAKLLALIRGEIRSNEQPAQRAGGLTVVLAVPRGGDPVSIPQDTAYPALPPVTVPEFDQ